VWGAAGSNNDGSSSHSDDTSLGNGPGFAMATSLQGKGVTTLMIRGLPPTLKQFQLMEELKICGFGDLYDFCYLPSAFDSGVNPGYAFVNFVSEAAASELVCWWHGQPRFGEGQRPLNISAAALQGVKNNMTKRLCRIRNPLHKPYLRNAMEATSGSSSEDSMRHYRLTSHGKVHHQQCVISASPVSANGVFVSEHAGTDVGLLAPSVLPAKIPTALGVSAPPGLGGMHSSSILEKRTLFGSPMYLPVPPGLPLPPGFA
jgi:hypothetical protein